jgi:hypothetical protein
MDRFDSMEEFDTNGSRSRRFPGKRRPAASPRCCEGERRGRERKRVWGEEPGRASFILSASVLFPKKMFFFAILPRLDAPTFVNTATTLT